MQRPCPRCAKPAALTTENAHRPFCSERCRMADLGAWLLGDYAIAGDRADDEDVEREARKEWRFE